MLVSPLHAHFFRNLSQTDLPFSNLVKSIEIFPSVSVHSETIDNSTGGVGGSTTPLTTLQPRQCLGGGGWGVSEVLKFSQFNSLLAFHSLN